MPEISEDATILIATSWQALNRAEYGDETTMICDCTVVIVFAAFFIEANLNKLIEEMNKKDEMERFFESFHPGLKDKLAWFYNSFIEQSKAINKDQLKRKIYPKLDKQFPGFSRIYNFRNNIAHGKIDRSSANLVDAEKLRHLAKDIVDELFKIAEQANYKVERGITYEIAINLNNDNRPNFGFHPAKNIISSHASS